MDQGVSVLIQNPILPGLTRPSHLLEMIIISLPRPLNGGGVQIHHSRDLVNWQLIGRTLAV